MWNLKPPYPGKTMFNIRTGSRHWIWYWGTWPFTRRNWFHDRQRKIDPYWRWFCIYTWFGKHLP